MLPARIIVRTIALLCLLASCREEKRERVVYRKPQLGSFVQAYVRFLDQERSTDAFCVFLYQLDDSTTVFSLSLSYPDLRVGAPLAFEKVAQYTAYFIGKEDSRYLTLPRIRQPLPAELLAYDAQIQTVKDPRLLPREDLGGTGSFTLCAANRLIVCRTPPSTPISIYLPASAKSTCKRNERSC
jgi:hypothetical protein